MSRTVRAAASIAALLTLAASPALALSITIDPNYDHPSAKVRVNGKGFTPDAAIDIYFDTTDELVVTADDAGKFGKHTIPVPAGAIPGEHWITAVERGDGQGVQKQFTVSTDWSEFGFDPRNRRNNPWENVISQSNVSTLDVMWSRKTGDAILSSPAVVNGIAYVGSDDKSLYAFDVTTGAVLWSIPTGNFVVSSPAVAAGTVYFGSEDGILYAVDAATGAAKWSFSLGAAIDSSPAVANGVVYVGSIASVLWALDATTGATLWTNLPGDDIDGSPAVSDGAVFTVAANGTVRSFDAATGTQLWSYETGEPNNSAPVLSGGSVWVVSSSSSGPYSLQRIRAADGVLDSLADLGGAGGFETVDPMPAVANGIVYVSISGQVMAIRPSGTNLTTAWIDTLDPGSLPTAPALANGIVYVGSGANGNFLTLDAATGNTLWSGVTAGTQDVSSPAISNGAVFIGGDKRLFAFALNGGDSAVYKRKHTQPPSFASLHPNFHLKPARSACAATASAIRSTNTKASRSSCSRRCYRKCAPTWRAS